MSRDKKSYSHPKALTENLATHRLMWYQTNVIQSSYVKSARMQFITIAEAILLPTAKAFPLFQP